MADAGRGRHEDGRPPAWLTADERLLIDGLNDAVIVADADGTILYANPASGRLLGWDVAGVPGSSLLRIVPERLRRLHEGAFAAYFSTGHLHRDGRPLRVPALRADGTETPIELLLSGVVGPDGGRLAVGTLRDARGRLDVERHQQVADQLLDILARGGSMADAAPRVLQAIGEALAWDVAALWIAEPSTGLRCAYLWHADGLRVERFAAATLGAVQAPGEGLPGSVLSSRSPAWLVDVADETVFPRSAAALEDGLRTALAVPVFADDDLVGVVELLSRTQRRRSSALLDALATIGERLGPFLVRVRAEEERAQLLADLGEARRAQAFVLRSSRAVAEARHYGEALERLARLAVPTLGDLCLIDVVEQSGDLRRMAACHADPGKREEVARLQAYPPATGGGHPVIEVLRSGRSHWSPAMTPEFLRGTTRNEEHLRILTELACASYMIVPLVAGEQTLGTVTLLSAGSGRRFSERDLELAENLAAQVAAVVDNARAYDTEHRIAHTLQRSLLPEDLSADARLDVAVRYLPATQGAEVGGDWYDLFPLPDGRVAAVVGDVEGHDMVAAAVMGQLRSVLRAYALDVASPADLLGRLSQFALVSGLPRLATVLLVVLDPDTGALETASAGHHPAMLVGPSPDPELLPVRPGPPIGLGVVSYSAQAGQLPADVGLLLYTDGLVESRVMTSDAGIRRVAAITAEAGQKPEALCAALEEAVAARGDREDDVAFMAVRWTPS